MFLVNRNIYLKMHSVFLFFLSILLILLTYSIISVAQTQENTWAKIYGSLKYDTATSVIKTSDGNYLIGGVTDRGLVRQRFGFGSLFVLEIATLILIMKVDVDSLNLVRLNLKRL
jgi:hypothetical protein